MKKHALLLLVMITTSSFCVAAKETPDWYGMMTANVPPAVVSAFLGAVTGAFNKYLERELKVNPKSDEGALAVLGLWFLEHIIRNKIIWSVQQDFDACSIRYKRNMMYMSAWIASWIAYTKT